MKTAIRPVFAATFFIALGFAISLRAQDAPVGNTDTSSLALPELKVLRAIPDDALWFVLVKNLGQTDTSLSKLGVVVKVPVPSVLSLLKLQAGIQEGLDASGSAAIAMLPDNEAQTGKSAFVPMVLIPVTDYKKFIGQLQPHDATAETTGVTISGHALVAGHKGSFAVFALPNNKERLAKALATTKGVDSLMESFEPWIGEHQISLIVTPSGSKMAMQAALAELKQFGAPMAAVQSAPQRAQVQMALKMYDRILSKASQEVDAFGVGVKLDENSNLSIDSHTTFVAGGSWAAAFQELKPSKENRFAGLGAAPFIFAAEGVWPDGWGKSLAAFSAGSFNQMLQASGGGELDKRQQEKYAEATESIMKGLRSASFAMKPTKPGEPLYDGVVALMNVDDTKSYLARYQKSCEEMGEITKGQKNTPFQISDIKRIEVDGVAGFAITMDMSGMMAAQKDPAMAKMIPLLFGPSGKLTGRMLAADSHTLVFAYGSEEHAKKALAAFKNPQSNLASDPEVAATLKLLPSHAQWVGLMSVKGYADFACGMMSTMGLPIKPPELPAMPPIGFAAEGGSQGLDTQLVLPAETLAGITASATSFLGHARAQ
jgi:hypothetical protein